MERKIYRHCREKNKKIKGETMEKERKLNLEEIKVQTFVTTLNDDQREEVVNGSLLPIGITSIRVFC
jgi:hypothetical protein